MCIRDRYSLDARCITRVGGKQGTGRNRKEQAGTATIWFDIIGCSFIKEGSNTTTYFSNLMFILCGGCGPRGGTDTYLVLFGSFFGVKSAFGRGQEGSGGYLVGPWEILDVPEGSWGSFGAFLEVSELSALNPVK